jgi:hypothetical protein
LDNFRRDALFVRDHDQGNFIWAVFAAANDPGIADRAAAALSVTTVPLTAQTCTPA